MIEVRLWEPELGGGECMACDPPADPPFIVTRVGGSPSTWSTRYCEECAVKMLSALLFVLGSNVKRGVITNALKEAAKKLDMNRRKLEHEADAAAIDHESVNRQVRTQRGGPHWLTAIERLKPGDACEFRYPARADWIPGRVVVNGGSGYWEIQPTASDHKTETGHVAGGLYIEHVRLPGQTEAWR